jgi:hypothetical protein
MISLSADGEPAPPSCVKMKKQKESEGKNLKRDKRKIPAPFHPPTPFPPQSHLARCHGIM